MTDRMRQLQRMLEQQPDDAFLLYGMAMEHKKEGDAAAALEYLGRVTLKDPNHSYAYYQRGLVHESQGDTEAARRSYREGIEAADRSGDAHARGELEAALDMLG
jgi:Flp pilus assembly protein TadD